jgi:outer membrane protein OmpU
MAARWTVEGNMRRALLGSTALVVLSLAAANAGAADGVKLSIGGWYHAAAGGVLGEDFSESSGVSGGDLRDYAFKQNVGVAFSGESVLDNGLTVGAYVELRGQTQEDQIRKVYAYFSGGFGKVQFGDQDSALAAMCYTVPTASKIFGADSPAVYGFNFSNAGLAGYGATNGTCYGIDSYSTQLVYFSPDLSGFQFALSFTPDQTEDTRNVLNGAGTRLRNDEGQNSENLSGALVFTHDFNGINLTVGGAHAFSFNKEVNPNNTGGAQDSNAYAQVSFAGFTIGGAMEYRQNFGDDGADQLVYGAGVTYNWDAWTVGLGWTRGDYEKAVGENDIGPFNAVYDDIAFTAAYALGPGITIDALLEYSRYKSNDAAGPDYQGIGIGLGTAIAF